MARILQAVFALWMFASIYAFLHGGSFTVGRYGEQIKIFFGADASGNPPGGRASLEPSILAVAFAIFMRSAFIGFPPVDVLERWPSHKDHRFGAKVK